MVQWGPCTEEVLQQQSQARPPAHKKVRIFGFKITDKEMNNFTIKKKKLQLNPWMSVIHLVFNYHLQTMEQMLQASFKTLFIRHTNWTVKGINLIPKTKHPRQFQHHDRNSLLASYWSAETHDIRWPLCNRKFVCFFYTINVLSTNFHFLTRTSL